MLDTRLSYGGLISSNKGDNENRYEFIKPETLKLPDFKRFGKKGY
jgi:hypothetical protein